MREEGLLSKEEAILKVEPKQLDSLLHPAFDANEIKKVMVSFVEALSDCAKLEQDIKMDGKLLLMTLAPKKE